MKIKMNNKTLKTLGAGLSCLVASQSCYNSPHHQQQQQLLLQQQQQQQQKNHGPILFAEDAESMKFNYQLVEHYASQLLHLSAPIMRKIGIGLQASSCDSSESDVEKRSRFEKYVQMRTMLPDGSIRQKMVNDGFSSEEIDKFFSSSSSSGGGDVGGNSNQNSNTNNNIIYDFEDADIPQRFLRGCNHDIVEARRRYHITKTWRTENNIDNILFEKQPNFFKLKKIYPHYTCGRGKGGHVIYWERAGELHMDEIVLSMGITVDQALRHWLFITEYQWNVLCKEDSADARSIAVIDIGKCHAGSLWGYTYEFVQKTVTYANMHYPDRSHAILIINAPWWFAYMWQVILPWVHEITRKKVRILSQEETLSGLQEFIDLDAIPIYYGGNLKFSENGGSDAADSSNSSSNSSNSNIDSCRFLCPEALELNRYVSKLNGLEVTNTNSIENNTKKSS